MTTQKQGEVLEVDIVDEMTSSYMDYAMSVIIGRAIPDVRDGLKPVHRRIIYSMNEMGLSHNRSFKKSARVVGDVIGKYHPHGDMAVYDAMARMVQDFSLRYPLVIGQGNFGSVDGDKPAAMRYTEVKLSRIAGEFLEDVGKDTVGFAPNFDDSLMEPDVLPTRVPNLLLNGASGIAVGMKTDIPPHNLVEVVDALLALIDEPNMPDEKLLEIIKGPDYPTGGLMFRTSKLRKAYLTGRGKVELRARAHIEDGGNGQSHIFVTEIPYSVNKSNLVESIASLARDGRIEGVKDIRDESDRQGMRVVIDVKRNASPEVILNWLYEYTDLEKRYSIILLALDQGRPKIMTLCRMLESFLQFREEIVTKRSRYELKKAEERTHILEGLKIALDDLDRILELIKKAADAAGAKDALVGQYRLSDAQVQAILDMRLQRLTGLEREKIESEYHELLDRVKELKDILSERARIMEIVKEELIEIKEKYGDERKTEIIEKPVEEITALTEALESLAV